MRQNVVKKGFRNTSNPLNRIWLPPLVIIVMIFVTARPSLAKEQESAEPRDITLLELGQSTERKASAGDMLEFGLRLSANDFSSVLVNARGLNLDVEVLSPDGKTLRRCLSRTGRPTHISLIGQSGGLHRIVARALGNPGTEGSLWLIFRDVRKSESKDATRIHGETLFCEAEELSSGLDERMLAQALEKYKASLSCWKELSDLEQISISAQRIASVYEKQGSLGDALRSYEMARRWSQETEDTVLQSEILSELGTVEAMLGNTDSALRSCTAALEGGRRADSIRATAKSLSCLGEVHYHLGELGKALGHYNDAREAWEQIGDLEGRALSLLHLGYTYSDLSELDKAFAHYHGALALWRAQNDVRGQALTMVAIGRLHFRWGENQRALNYYSQAMEIVEPSGDKVWQASILSGIGAIYLRMAEPRNAIDYFARALEYFRVAKLRMAVDEVLILLGQASLAQGDSASALEYIEEALVLSRELENQRWESVCLGLIGSAYELQGDLLKALEHYKRSLAIKKPGEDRRFEAYTLADIGGVYEKLGERDKALEYFSRATELSRSAYDPFGERTGLYRLAKARSASGQLDEARQHLEDSLNIAETLRGNIGSLDLRSSFVASIHDQYELYEDVLMRLHEREPSHGYASEALHVSERARARSLLDILTEAQVDIRQDVDPKLLERDRALTRTLANKVEQRTRFLGEEDEQKRLELEEEIQKLNAEYDQLKSIIRSQSPHYAALTQPDPLRLEQIQQDILDEDTLLLEYAMGSERCYLWAIGKNDFNSYVLSGRKQIEDAAERVHRLLTARQPRRDENVADYRNRVKKADSAYWQEARQLSGMLLGPVADYLANKRIIIVADGMLQYIPFGALPTPQDGQLVPLIVANEIVSLPSASALSILRHENRMQKRPEKIVAVLADPVFEHDDPRIRLREKDPSVPSRFHTRSFDDVHYAFRGAGLVQTDTLRIPRLPATRWEAEDIVATLSEDESFKALDFAASRETALSPELRHYRIIHFATHGLVNNERPELSGIILSMVDERGLPKNGFLRLHDIYNLDLPVELVVLSACNSALGKRVRGEGLIGIVRGFMYAGAERVVASLWKVDDEATGELMKVFYQEMLEKGLTPAAALRQAQIAMWQQRDWRHPFYWAAFVLQGEWM